jgi:hypothetical protein
MVWSICRFLCLISETILYISLEFGTEELHKKAVGRNNLGSYRSIINADLQKAETYFYVTPLLYLKQMLIAFL